MKNKRISLAKFCFFGFLMMSLTSFNLFAVNKAAPSDNNENDIIKNAEVQQDTTRIIKGKVTNSQTGQPVDAVAIIVIGTKVGTYSGTDGTFEIKVKDGQEVAASIVGMTSQRIRVTSSTKFLDFKLTDTEFKIEDLVVTGIATRKAESYTGSAVTIKGDELKRVGNQNLFQSLKNLDPSVYIMENLQMGSDPNSLPNMNMRGGTSFNEGMGTSDLKGNYENKPNQPLFILDGFEVTAERVFDLDMQTVESLTILKDASAKAIYGSKAANGVVVIETKKLIAQKPRITYTGSLDLTMPDLSSYNLCSPLEKLDVELKENTYSDTNPSSITNYYKLRKQVLEGLDTYWLSKPVQMGYGQKHSLNIELGKDELRTSANVSYYDNVGVMKGSDRTTLNGSFNLVYRLKDKVKFQNSLNITNNNASDSPYGSFGTYTLLNSYVNPYDEDGNLVTTLSKGGRNPLLDATIGTSLTSKYFEITNNFEAEYTVIEGLRLRARFSVNKKNNSADRYYPSTHSRFASYSNTIAHRKGQYEANNGSSDKLTGDFYVNYSTKIKDVHNIFVNAGFNLAENKYHEVINYVEGIPSTNMNDIMFALQYNADKMRPSGTSGFTREVGVLTVLSYTYMDRFLFDGTFRLNASSVFGSTNRWAPFWSVGVGWNLHKESFFKDLSDIKLFKIRGSVGSTGNQSFLTNKSLTVNNYYMNDRYTDFIGAYAANMENPDLKWEQKMEYDAGIDAELYGFNFRFDVYKTLTQNLVTSLSTAPSTGFTNVSENLGFVENKGVEAYLSYTLFQNRNGFIRLSGSYTNNKNTILEISEAMRTYNDTQKAYVNDRTDIKLKTGTVILYYDGLPMNTIWAVPSYGIDPATGVELLIDNNGEATYTWNAADMVPSGISVPKWRGNFGFNGEYKGIGISVTCTYMGGGQYYNQTLVDKIENILITNNFDRRVLTERWSTPGQEAQYKMTTAFNVGSQWHSALGRSQKPTRATQRFVQDQNELNISSIGVYYDFNRKWLSSLGLERLKFAAFMNDVVKFSTIGIERGTTYPFARTISFSVTATF